MPDDTRSPTLSVCLIVKNERGLLDRCLSSVKEIADEIVVVDTGSSDGSAEVAKARGARLIQTSWTHDFSAARNQALEAATSDWILVLDADEYLLRSDARTVRETLAAAREPRAFSLLQHSPGAAGVGGMLVSIVRLFPRRADIRYEWPIHEQVVTSLHRSGIPIEATSIRIQHTGYADPATNREKQRRNQAILLAQVNATHEPPAHALFLLAGTYLDLGDPSGALPWYRRVIALPGTPADLREGAAVRAAGCLAKTGHPLEALEALERSGSSHPEAILLRAELEEALGRPDGRRHRERLLGCADQAYIPPCNLPALKAAAVAGLAGAWRAAGKQDLAIALLREAKAKVGSAEGFTRSDLERLYAAHGVSLAP